jgi:hypothetical protein
MIAQLTALICQRREYGDLSEETELCKPFTKGIFAFVFFRFSFNSKTAFASNIC